MATSEGDIETHDGVCATLAQDAGVVVSVDYRRPPEHPFPDPNDDAYAAACWVAEHADELAIDAAHLGVAGDSARISPPGWRWQHAIAGAPRSCCSCWSTR